MSGRDFPFELRPRLQAARILVVGDAMLDRYWHGSVDRISPEAPVPVVRVTGQEDRLGGAANVAINARAVGASATLLSVAGDDDAGRRLHQLLEQHGIQSRLSRDASLQTIVKLRVIGRAQQLIRVDFENTPAEDALSVLLNDFRDMLPQHDAVVFSDYGKGALAHVTSMIALARALGKPVLVDPKGRDYSRYRGATAITPNRTEMAQVVGEWLSDAELGERAQALRDALGLQGLIVTMSEAGMALFDADGEFRVPAQAREVFDVTGAGDTVIAVLAAMLACGLDLRTAMPIANRAGGVAVGKLGTASVSFEELFA